jgi:hypothetical protein
MVKRSTSLFAILAINLFTSAGMSATFALPSFELPRATRSGGEVGGGGGTANPGPLLEPAQIKEILLDIQKPTAAFFNYISIATFNVAAGPLATGGDQWIPLGSKLYLGHTPDAILRKVLSVKPTILDQGDCEDPDGNHKDASALRNPDRVCFSVERLAKRGDIRSTNARTILTALSAHEYAHLVGASESEADYLQNVLGLERLSERSYEIVRRYDEVTQAVNELANEARQLQAKVRKNAPASELCFLLGATLARMGWQSHEWFHFDSGVSYFSRREFDVALPALYKSGNFSQFCSDSGEARAWREKVFAGRPEISVEEYLKAMGSEGHIPVKGVVRRLEPGDYRTLRLEIDDLVRDMSKLSELGLGSKGNK